MKSKKELEEDFHWWISSIPDKIISLEDLIPPELFLKLDYSVESLDNIGDFLITNASVQSIRNHKDLWDAIASYIGAVYEKHVPSAKWYLELEDEKNIYYGIPILKTSAFTTFAPHYEITTMLDRRRADFLSAITKKHIQLQNT
jgi:hypothetical protein